MLIPDELLKEFKTLRNQQRDDLLEERLLREYADLKKLGDVEKLAFIVSELAHFYTVSGIKDLKRAEEYHLELERLEPGAQSKWITAGFFHAFGSPMKVIEKVNEIDPKDPDCVCRYSALALKGEAFISLNSLDAARETLDELLRMTREHQGDLPYGDEIVLLEASTKVSPLIQKSRELLDIVTPRIQDKVYQERGQKLLQSVAGGQA